MVPFCPFYFSVPFLKPNGKKKGTLIVMGLLRNLVKVEAMEGHSEIRDMGLSES